MLDAGYWMLDKDTNWIHTSSIKHPASDLPEVRQVQRLGQKVLEINHFHFS